MGYKFIDKENNFSKLINKLEKFGLIFISKSSSYNSETLHFSWKWKLSEKVKLSWNREFVNDGMDEQDTNVELIIENKTVDAIDIDLMLRSKLELPLDEAIMNGVCEMMNKLKNS